MFRSLSGFADISDHKNFVEAQDFTFTKQLPNAVGTLLPTTSTNKPKDVLSSARFGLSTWDPNTRQTDINGIDLANYATSIEVSQDLLDADQKCKTTNLDSLINTYNPGDKLRCGWIYEKGTPTDQPKISQGALGTRDGPAGFISDNPKGTWYWNLDDAKKAIMGDRCSALVNCKNVGAVNYANCAFSKTRGMGVPVDNKGNLMYPREPKLSAPRSSLVTTPNKCAPPPAPGSPQYNYARSRDVCMPLESGKLSRDCMLQQLVTAGCNDKGSLYQALLNKATPDNYAQGISGSTMYQRYQSFAKTPFIEGALRDGSVTSQMALANFKALSTEASFKREDVLSYAARDMCLKQGTFDQFDFCLELKDSSSPPFALECLQKEFRNQGGQPAGSVYPSAANKFDLWDTIGSWGNVRQAISDLAAKTRSSQEPVQRMALKQFMGIVRERLPFGQIGFIPGVEILWFNRGNRTFLGRRQLLANGELPEFTRIGGEVANLGLSDNLEFYTVTNLRPTSDIGIRIYMESDDGIAYVLNKTVDGDKTRNRFSDTSDEFIANWDQAPTGYTQKNSWALKADGPNYVMGFWQETGGGAHHQFYYMPLTGGVKQRIPLSWYSQVQEPDAPQFSWQGLKDDRDNLGFDERRFPSIVGLTINTRRDLQRVPQNAIPNLNAILNLTTYGNCFGKSVRNFAMNSWRTITCLFFANRGNTRAGTLFSIGPLTVGLSGTNLLYNWQGSTLSAGNSKNPISGIVNDGFTPHLLYVNMRSDYESKYPNRFTIGCATVADWKSGSVTLGPGNSQVQSFTTQNNRPLYGPGDGFPLNLGNASSSANGGVGWIRFFDYELDNKDLLRDCNNDWKMAFTTYAN